MKDDLNHQLCLALVVHKAQGMTTDRAVTLVDEKMSAAQLYVAMSRGREENLAFVVSFDDAPEDHVHRPTLAGLDVLRNVMRHDGMDRSAHEVLRDNLGRYEEIAWLQDLYQVARDYRDQQAGPDLTNEIEALAPKANLEHARNALAQAQETVGRTQERRTEAENRAAEFRKPLRAKFPGRRGSEAQAQFLNSQYYVQRYAKDAQHNETEALQKMEAARQRLFQTERNAERLAKLRAAQTRRERWVDEHPDEEQWGRELRDRIANKPSSDRAMTRDPHESEAQTNEPSRIPKESARVKKIVADLAERTAPEYDPATEAVLRHPLRRTPPGHIYAPQPPPHVLQPRGPVLGR